MAQSVKQLQASFPATNKKQNWFKQDFNDTTRTTQPHYSIVEVGANSPGSAADGRAQQSGWQSTETAAPNFGEHSICPVMTGDRGAGCRCILIRTGRHAMFKVYYILPNAFLH